MAYHTPIDVACINNYRDLTNLLTVQQVRNNLLPWKIVPSKSPFPYALRTGITVRNIIFPAIQSHK